MFGRCVDGFVVLLLVRYISLNLGRRSMAFSNRINSRFIVVTIVVKSQTASSDYAP